MLFLGKNVLFSVEPPIFSEKHDYSEGFEHKEVNFFQNLLYCTNFLEEKILALLRSAQSLLLYVTTAHIYLWI